jgi:predicted HTH transcriptional regulator
METVELIERISNGEDSYTQFKENITNNDKLAEELVAFSNSKGGVLIIGVSDYNDVIGISDDDIRRLNQLIGNVINSNITPPIYPITEIKTIEDKKLLIVTIESGSNKPYSTNKGIYLTKAGSDKRKVSPEELRRLFSESKRLYADEEILRRTTISDINSELFYKFLENDNKKILEGLKNDSLDLITILNNYNLMSGNYLTLAGNLLFGINIKKYNPMFFIDCCYFVGNDSSSSSYRSEKRIYGTFQYLFENSLAFITSNLKSQQSEENFNTSGKLEIDESVLVELIINALIHRDYYINSSIKIFIFDDRIEIINPGKLTNSLTIEKIKNGISIARNPILDSIVKNLLPYSGRGSGIKRALKINPNIEFINDIDKEEFKCIIPRN